ncbi:MAG: nucleotidyltransferase [Chloroflexota bacterium]|nr:nucleotidyltransferase [Chloroflexota bacterium]
MDKPTLIIMAAGLGSRYGGLKQIDPVGPGGELIIDYSIYDALRVGFGKIVFVLKKELEYDFREVVGDRIDRQCQTVYVFQSVDIVPEGVQIPAGRTKPWGTGQATLLCRDVVDGPFAVINADDFYGLTSFQTLQYYLVTAHDVDNVYNYCMVGYMLEKTLTEHGHVARGVSTVDENGYLVEIHERTHIEKFADAAKYTEDGGKTWHEIPMHSPVSMNMWGFTLSIFDELEAAFPLFFQGVDNLEKAEFFLPDVVDSLLKSKKARVKVLPTNERWVGITYRADKPIVEGYINRLVQQGLYPKKLWE